MEGEPIPFKKNFYQGIQKDKYELLLSEKEKIQSKKTNDEVLKKKIMLWAEEYYSPLNIRPGKDFFENFSILAMKMKESSKQWSYFELFLILWSLIYLNCLWIVNNLKNT